MNKLKHFCTLTDPTTSEYFTRILKIEKIRKCHKVQLESTNRCRRLFRLETGYDKSYPQCEFASSRVWSPVRHNIITLIV